MGTMTQTEHFTDVYDDIYGDPGTPGEEVKDTLAWIEPDGTITPLDGDIIILEGVNGLRYPAVRRTHEQVAGQAGTRKRNINYDMRTNELPVMFVGGSEQDLRDNMRAWEHRFDPTRGDGRLRVSTVDNKTLDLTCAYAEGLEGNEDGSHRFEGQPIRLAVLVFEADDPFWYEVTPSTQTWALGGTARKWFPILPISLGSSTIGGTITVQVDGQVATWPVWTIIGPASNLELTNETTGRTLEWAGSLAAGDQLVIDTRPGRKTVLHDGLPAFASLTAWDMWPLVTGLNNVTAAVSDSTGATSARASWQPAWLGY